MSNYKIYIDNGTGKKEFYIPGINDLALADIHYKPVAGSAGSLSFTVPAVHPLHNQIHPLSTDFLLYKGEKKIFRGRYVGREEDFYKTGKIKCEGDLNFLVDSVQDPYEYTGDISGFFDKLLNAHNVMVEPRKQFQRGTVNVVDENNYINRSNSKYSTTAESFKGKLIETHGGFLRTRHVGDTCYLDYVYDYGGTNKQVIRFGQNLIDLTKYIDATKIITALIPIGADVEYTDELGETQTRTVDISSVNNGKKYIVNQAAADIWGMIWGTHEWKDVTLPKNLLKKAEAYLEECVVLPETMKLTALDLSLCDTSVEDFEVGKWTRAISVPHDLTALYMIYEMDINISEPGKSTISLGGKVQKISGATAKNKIEASRRVQLVAEETSREINRRVENATTLITGGFGGYVVLDNIDPASGKKMHPWRILIMNAPDKSVATNVIQINQNGIGFSTTGINGPYRNAWTIDGNLVADFVTTGTMLADRIRGGLLEVGGAGLGKDGVIAVKDAAGSLLCKIDKAGMQFYDGQNNVTAIFNKNGVDVRKGTIKGANLTLGGIGNADGTMVLLDTEGNVICSADNTGFRIYKGIIASYSDDGNNRSTVTDGSFKTWLGNDLIMYLGNGGYEGHGSDGSAVLWVGGKKYITLDGENGGIAGEFVNASGKDSIFRGAEFNGGVSVHGTLTADRIEAPDVYGGGTSLETLAGRCNGLGEKISGLEGRIAALEGKVV